jgi:hypothetical protein
LRHLAEFEDDCDGCAADIAKWKKRVRQAEEEVERMRFEVVEDDE